MKHISKLSGCDRLLFARLWVWLLIFAGSLSLFSPWAPSTHASEFSQLKEAAEKGDLEAQFKLGAAYDAGSSGAPVNYTLAYEWTLRAAQRGHGQAQANLAGLLMYNLKDPDRAFKTAMQSAKAGVRKGQYYLAICYAQGVGTPVNKELSLKWNLASAKQGFPGACYNLARAYERGIGTGIDLKSAFKWYSVAAEAGVPAAQNNLANLYQNGKGVKQDFQKAMEWYQKAAAQGYAMAESNIGNLYLHGLGVPKDQAEAIRHYRAAAAKGYENAIKMLREMKQTVLEIVSFGVSPRVARPGGKLDTNMEFFVYNAEEARPDVLLIFTVMNGKKALFSSPAISLKAYADRSTKRHDSFNASKKPGDYILAAELVCGQIRTSKRVEFTIR